MSGSTGGKTCDKCQQNGQHTASCPRSTESAEQRRKDREGR